MKSKIEQKKSRERERTLKLFHSSPNKWTWRSFRFILSVRWRMCKERIEQKKRARLTLTFTCRAYVTNFVFRNKTKRTILMYLPLLYCILLRCAALHICMNDGKLLHSTATSSGAHHQLHSFGSSNYIWFWIFSRNKSILTVDILIWFDVVLQLLSWNRIYFIWILMQYCWSTTLNRNGHHERGWRIWSIAMEISFTYFCSHLLLVFFSKTNIIPTKSSTENLSGKVEIHSE